jgi:hypothetical protein
MSSSRKEVTKTFYSRYSAERKLIMPVAEMEKEKSALSAEENSILEMSEIIQENRQQDKNFADSLDDFLKSDKKSTDFIHVGNTPNALAISGANPNLEVVISPATIAKCMSEAGEHYHGHGLSQEIMEQLPQELRNPVMVFKGSAENSLVAITELKDKEQRGIMVAVSLSNKGKRHEVNRISSAYGRNNMSNYLKKQIEGGNLISANIEKANEMLQSARLQLPLEETFISFDNSIAYTTANVKYPKEELTKETQFHNPVEHGKLLPFLNAKADFHESRLETLKEKRDTRTAKIEKNETKIGKLSAKADKLEDLNKMLGSLAERNPAVKAFVERNEKKIQTIRNQKIPNRQSKILYHKTRIAEIDNKSAVIGHKLERCVALSDTVKSFGVLGAERRQAFSQAMNKLNQSTVDCLNDKKATLNNKLDFAIKSYGSALVADKSEVQKDINKLQSQIAAIDGKIAKISSELPKSEIEIDTAMQNTANAVQTCIEKGEMSVSKLSETACIAATDENPFEYLKNTEMAIEGNYNSIDGIINNGSKEELEHSRTDILNSIQAAEDLKDNPFVSNDIKELAEKDITRLQGELAAVDKALSSERNETAVENDKSNGIKVNADYYKELPKNDRHIETMSEAQATAVMLALTAAGVKFSAASRGEDKVGITVSKKDISSLNDVMYSTIGKIAHTEAAKENAGKGEKGKYETINPEYYASLSEEQRQTRTEAKDDAREIVKGLMAEKIPYSAVVRKNDTVAITVSKENANTYKQIEGAVKGEKSGKFLNPEFYKSLGKNERFTQRMDEQSAKELASELEKNGIEHSAVIDGEKSAVTVRQSDVPKAKGFFMNHNKLQKLKETAQKQQAQQSNTRTDKNKNRSGLE